MSMDWNFEEDEISEIADSVILEDIKDTWDELFDIYEELFDCPIEIDVLGLQNIGVKFELSNKFDNYMSLGEVAVTRDGKPLRILFNKVIYGFKSKYFYSTIIHEMCHLSATLSDLSKNNFNPEIYEKCNGHTQSWQDRVDRFNNIKNSKGENVFMIVPYLTKELSIKDMLE